MTGGDYERELATTLHHHGHHVIRAPTSGSATKRALPDLLHAKHGNATALEHKTTGKNTAYYTEEEITALQEFADAFHATARISARYKGDTTYYIYNIDDARRTPTGRYAVDREIEAVWEFEPP